jgi:hypothetical protein
MRNKTSRWDSRHIQYRNKRIAALNKPRNIGLIGTLNQIANALSESFGRMMYGIDWGSEDGNIYGR